MKKLIPIALFLGIILIICSPVSSEKISNLSNQKNNVANAEKQNSEIHDQIAQPLSSNINSGQGTQHDDGTNNEKEKRILDLFLVVFTGVLAIVAFFQWRTFRTQAQQLQQTNEVMKDTAQRQLRAYVCISSGIIEFSRGRDVPIVKVNYKNCGQTPAYDVRSWIHIWITDDPLKEILPVPPEDYMTSVSIIPPGGFHFMVIEKDPPIPSNVLHLIGTSQGTVYIYGEIRYRDAFNIERFTRYRLIYGGSEENHGGHLKPHTDGNDAN